MHSMREWVEHVIDLGVVACACASRSSPPLGWWGAIFLFICQTLKLAKKKLLTVASCIQFKCNERPKMKEDVRGRRWGRAP